MSIVLSRRNFLTSFAAGAALLALPEPVRRYWQVPGNAPVGLGSGLRYSPGVVVVRTEMDDGSQLVSTFTTEDMQKMVATLEAANVSPHEDGRYHVHLAPGMALGA